MPGQALAPSSQTAPPHSSRSDLPYIFGGGTRRNCGVTGGYANLDDNSGSNFLSDTLAGGSLGELIISNLRRKF